MFTSPTGSIYVGGAPRFWDMRLDLVEDLLKAPVVHGARWQQLDVSKSDAHATHELLNVSLWYDMPESVLLAQNAILPDLPWAEGHFQERVQGYPTNPGRWHHRWPYHAGQVDLHQRGGRYDHNYMERMWASQLRVDVASSRNLGRPIEGYRFPVGDLGDVVKQLQEDRTTRQAYLPIWFPEDTGAIRGQRVPCTLGYHFIIREDVLHLQYTIRSCDIYRHFTNDVYMAVRLAQWVRDRVEGDRAVTMGQLSMHVVSMHAFVGDVDKIREKLT